LRGRGRPALWTRQARWAARLRAPGDSVKSPNDANAAIRETLTRGGCAGADHRAQRLRRE
jgi:hypothetical protein